MKTSLRFCLAAGALLLAAVTVRADDLGTVRARMEQRLFKLDALKSNGAIGENNRGFVEVREDRDDAGNLCAEENRDREAVYAEIAKRNGTSTDQVGRLRAKKIAESSATGVWLQREDGSWHKK